MSPRVVNPTAQSSGPLRYSRDEYGYKVIVEVDPELNRLARSLIPRAWRVQPQKWAPHITVVRAEVPKYLDQWGRYEGEEITFEYERKVEWDHTYFWLNVICPALSALRVELGLPPTSRLTRPPGDRPCFHTTLGNVKTAFKKD